MALREQLDVLKRGTVGEGIMPPQLAFVMHLPGRRFVQFSKAELVDRLQLEPTSRVLEVGPGSGYFSIEVARRVPQGELILLDVQPQMLAKARKRLDAAGVTNVRYVDGDIATAPLGDGEVDVAFLITVLGEVTDRPGCIRAIERALRPGGLLSISENRIDPDFTSQEEVRALCETNGFVLDELIGSKRNYTANFRKPVAQ